MGKIQYLLAVIFTIFSIINSLAQEIEETENRKNKLAIIMGHAFIPEGIKEDGSKTALVLASWGIDYDHYFTEKWGIGIHSDFVVSNYKVEKTFDKDDVVLERERPLIFCLVATHKFTEHFSAHIGAGEEFAKEEDYFVIRIGAEMGWEISEDWEVGINISNDLRPEAFNSTSIGFSFGRLF